MHRWLRAAVAASSAATLVVACGDTAVTALEVGACFDDPGDLSQGGVEVGQVDTIDCAQPHDNEVYALADYEGGDDEFPGDDDIDDFAREACLDAYEPYVGIDYQDSRFLVGTIKPTGESWAQGDREVVCFLYHPDGEKLTGSKRDSNE